MKYYNQKTKTTKHELSKISDLFKIFEDETEKPLSDEQKTNIATQLKKIHKPEEVETEDEPMVADSKPEAAEVDEPTDDATDEKSTDNGESSGDMDEVIQQSIATPVGWHVVADMQQNLQPQLKQILSRMSGHGAKIVATSDNNNPNTKNEYDAINSYLSTATKNDVLTKKLNSINGVTGTVKTKDGYTFVSVNDGDSKQIIGWQAGKSSKDSITENLSLFNQIHGNSGIGRDWVEDIIQGC